MKKTSNIEFVTILKLIVAALLVINFRFVLLGGVVQWWISFGGYALLTVALFYTAEINPWFFIGKYVALGETIFMAGTAILLMTPLAENPNFTVAVVAINSCVDIVILLLFGKAAVVASENQEIHIMVKKYRTRAVAAALISIATIYCSGIINDMFIEEELLGWGVFFLCGICYLLLLISLVKLVVCFKPLGFIIEDVSYKKGICVGITVAAELILLFGGGNRVIHHYNEEGLRPLAVSEEAN